MRKLWFAHLARALVVFPGGFGTLDECMEMLTLAQTNKIERKIPIILYGRRYWNEIVNFDALARYGKVAKEDLNLFQFADDPTTALGILRASLGGRHRPHKPSFREIAHFDMKSLPRISQAQCELDSGSRRGSLTTLSSECGPSRGAASFRGARVARRAYPLAQRADGFAGGAGRSRRGARSSIFARFRCRRLTADRISTSLLERLGCRARGPRQSAWEPRHIRSGSWTVGLRGLTSLGIAPA